MRKIFSLSLLCLFLGCNSSASKKETAAIEVSATEEERDLSLAPLNQFQAVWNEVESDSLNTLPQESVSYSKLFDGAIDIISRDARRTLSNQENIIEYFDKLAHPNGVCLKGLWQIDVDNPYSGYFKNGSEALIIARASSAMSETKRGKNRAFGMAGKLFPTTDTQKINESPSANFFVIDDLGGTDAEYYTDVALTNEPDVSFTSSIFSSFAYGLKVASAFSNADENFGIRQLYEISYLGEENGREVITPKWLKIEADQNQTKFGVNDFRDEFILEEDEKLIFNIFVSSKEQEGEKAWQKIGTIMFDASVISTSCDHRLHFHHPLWRDDIIYE